MDPMLILPSWPSHHWEASGPSGQPQGDRNVVRGHCGLASDQIHILGSPQCPRTTFKSPWGRPVGPWRLPVGMARRAKLT